MDQNHSERGGGLEIFDMVLDMNKKIISGDLSLWGYSQQVAMILSSPDYSMYDRENLELYLKQAEERFLSTQNNIDLLAVRK